MNCIIIDDEPHAIDVLKRYAEKTPVLVLKGTFRNAVKALDFLHYENIDLIFLDVNMPDLSGIQFLKALKQKPLVVFTTAYSEYAVESYEWDAVDYLVKPIVFERFLKAVEKAQLLFDKHVQHITSDRDDVLMLKSGSQVHRVAISDILYVVKESNYLEVVSTEKKILVRGNMNDIFSWLPADRFFRVHKSYVVSIAHVDTIEAHQVKVNKMMIPLGASYREDFYRRMGMSNL